MIFQHHSPMITDLASSESSWNLYDDKLFEKAILLFPHGTTDRWQKIAGHVPGKTPENVRNHYDVLVHDLLQIDLGRIKLPFYSDEDVFERANQISERVCHISDGLKMLKHGEVERVNQISERVNQISVKLKTLKHGEIERKKGTPWSEDEHRRFLQGLELFGKGDWRNIARRVVKTRTATQVASHAQKYFLRQNSTKKERKRSSIHDITTIADTMPAPTACNFSAQGGQFPLGYPSYGFPISNGDRYSHCI